MNIKLVPLCRTCGCRPSLYSVHPVCSEDGEVINEERHMVDMAKLTKDEWLNGHRIDMHEYILRCSCEDRRHVSPHTAMEAWSRANVLTPYLVDAGKKLELPEGYVMVKRKDLANVYNGIMVQTNLKLSSFEAVRKILEDTE